MARILVVDDTPANVKLLEALLLPQGYDVVAAESGEEALRAVADASPDLVLLDIRMPGMDGYEVCRRLRADEATRLLPVVMITAFLELERVNALEAGADDFITKPFNKAELFARVGSLLRIKKYQDELAELNRNLETRVQQLVDERERLKGLRRFLPPKVAERIIDEGDWSILESHRREITVVVCALRGFTAFSELAEPEDVLRILREYHEAMGQIIGRFEGTLDRFAADEITVFFNDPEPCLDPPSEAVRMTLEMRRRVQTLTRSWRRLGHELDFAAGVAMGYATLGQIGIESRLDYGAIGTVMSLAARLCDEAQPGQIWVGQRVSAATEKEVDVESLGDVPLAGFMRPIPAYRVVGLRGRHGPGGLDPELDRITDRERQVAALICRGASNRDIAEKLVITEGTAANHVEHVLTKLGFTNRAQIAAWATEHGLNNEPPE